MIEQMGPYRIIRVLGRGGMGTVYEAVHEETAHQAAVKALSTALADDGNFRQRFVTEIETLRKLDHPHIVRFFGEGDKVKVTLRFRGREMAHQELGMRVLDRVKEELDELGKVEQFPKMEGRQMTMVLAPR